jgi:hypothetical protein
VEAKVIPEREHTVCRVTVGTDDMEQVSPAVAVPEGW